MLMMQPHHKVGVVRGRGWKIMKQRHSLQEFCSDERRTSLPPDGSPRSTRGLCVRVRSMLSRSRATVKLGAIARVCVWVWVCMWMSLWWCVQERGG